MRFLFLGTFLFGGCGPSLPPVTDDVNGYSDTDVKDFLDQRGYMPGAHYTDESNQTYMDIKGYVPGPHFSGHWDDLQGKPEGWNGTVVPYEPFGPATSSGRGADVNGRIYFMRFFAPSKGTYTSLKVLADNRDGTLLAGIYDLDASGQVPSTLLDANFVEMSSANRITTVTIDASLIANEQYFAAILVEDKSGHPLFWGNLYGSASHQFSGLSARTNYTELPASFDDGYLGTSFTPWFRLSE